MLHLHRTECIRSGQDSGRGRGIHPWSV